MSIMDINGGSLVAMKGEGIVCIACDRRIGFQYQTIATNYQRVFKMENNILLGLAGLATDISTFHALMEFKMNLYRLREGHPMKPSTFATVVATTLYEHRFSPYFLMPIVVGIEDSKPLIYSSDLHGAMDEDNFACAGTAAEFLLGACEGFFKAGLKEEELKERTAQTLLSACDRDAASGWGGIVYLLSEKKLDIKVLKTTQC